jgi:hypothetical protein
VTATHPVGADEATEVGTPTELAAGVSGPHVLPMRWWAHGPMQSSFDTELTLELSVQLQSARFVEQRAVNPEQAYGCENLLEIDAVLRFDTADGAFGEQFTGVLSKSASSGEARFTGSFPAAELRGTYDASGILANYRDPEYSVHLWLSPALDTGESSFSGNVSLNGADADDDPSTTVVSAAIAEFPSGAGG